MWKKHIARNAVCYLFNVESAQHRPLETPSRSHLSAHPASASSTTTFSTTTHDPSMMSHCSPLLRDSTEEEKTSEAPVHRVRRDTVSPSFGCELETSLAPSSADARRVSLVSSSSQRVTISRKVDGTTREVVVRSASKIRTSLPIHKSVSNAAVTNTETEVEQNSFAPLIPDTPENRKFFDPSYWS